MSDVVRVLGACTLPRPRQTPATARPIPTYTHTRTHNQHPATCWIVRPLAGTGWHESRSFAAHAFRRASQRCAASVLASNARWSVWRGAFGKLPHSAATTAEFVTASCFHWCVRARAAWAKHDVTLLWTVAYTLGVCAGSGWLSCCHL